MTKISRLVSVSRLINMHTFYWRLKYAVFLLKNEKCGKGVITLF